jgi:hypothetical protein
MRIYGSLCLLLALVGLSAAQDTNFPAGPQYLITPGLSPLFMRPIATPSLSLDAPPPTPSPVTEITAKADEQTYEVVSTILDEQRQTGLLSIYYGLPQVSVAAIALGEPVEVSRPVNIPNPGVVEFTSVKALHERGYGVTLAEAAARSKAHKVSARHVYTNEDLERLRPRD